MDWTFTHMHARTHARPSEESGAVQDVHTGYVGQRNSKAADIRRQASCTPACLMRYFTHTGQL